MICIVALMRWRCPKKLIERLREWESFQGARYELAVTSFLVQLDYRIEYPKTGKEKTCELIARHPLSGECFGVEAKSRHRSGVLHEPGSREQPEELKIGVTGRLNEAIGQRPAAMPFIIFIDLNLPWSGKEGLDKPWLGDIKQAIGHQEQISESNPEKFNALFITNYSYHYEGKTVMDNSGKYAGDMIVIIPRFTEHSFKQMGNLADVSVAVQQYGYVPDRNDGSDPKKIAEEKLKKRFSILQDCARYMIGSKTTSKNPPTITTLLVCREIVMNEKALHLKYIGHTLISVSSKGTVDLCLYIEGHWFVPSTVKLKIVISDESGNKVCEPPIIPATVSENGIFETKLIMEKAFPFKPGRYEIMVSVENGPSATTELFLVT